VINIQNTNPNILVIGDLILDHYLWGDCNRISPEAPVQIIDIQHENTILGGAGNVANNLKELGSSVDILSVIGDCKTSIELKDSLVNAGVSTKYLIIEENRITAKKTRIIASHQQVVRYDREITNEIKSDSQFKIINLFEKIIEEYDCVLLSDYGKGVLTFSLTQALIKITNKHNKKILIDPKGNDYSKYTGAFLLTPNKTEASQATGIKINNTKSLKEALIKLKNKYKLMTSVITLSEQGIAVYDKNLRIFPTIAREVFDVTGAGDTVLAALGFALACDNSIDEALKFSNLAAGIVVGKIGSSTVTLNEIIDFEASLLAFSSESLIKSMNEINSISQALKAKGKKIIFTNGCFDILHLGHIKYLESAKSFGDILIVGINSDKSVKALKGSSRPINEQTDRAYLIAALKAVDLVVIFDEDTPYELIKIIQPDVLVKGGDYKDKSIVGQDIVNDVKLVEFINGRSTSSTIQKIGKGN